MTERGNKKYCLDCQSVDRVLKTGLPVHEKEILTNCSKYMLGYYIQTSVSSRQISTDLVNNQHKITFSA
jgi:hypothetical protein